jgi:hypothetical protein
MVLTAGSMSMTSICSTYDSFANSYGSVNHAAPTTKIFFGWRSSAAAAISLIYPNGLFLDAIHIQDANAILA